MPSAVTEGAPRSGPHALWALGGRHEGLCAPEAVPVGLLGEGSDRPPRAARLWRVLYTQVRPEHLAPCRAVRQPLRPSRHGVSPRLPRGSWSLLDQGCVRGPTAGRGGQRARGEPTSVSRTRSQAACVFPGVVFARRSASPGAVSPGPPCAACEESAGVRCGPGGAGDGHGPVPALGSRGGVQRPRASPTRSSPAASALGGQARGTGRAAVLRLGPLCSQSASWSGVQPRVDRARPGLRCLVWRKCGASPRPHACPQDGSCSVSQELGRSCRNPFGWDTAPGQQVCGGGLRGPAGQLSLH